MGVTDASEPERHRKSHCRRPRRGRSCRGTGGRRGGAREWRADRITLVEKAAEDEAGGNTRWSPSNMRMAAPDRVEPSFVHDMLAATQFQGDETYFARLAAEAPATIKWLASFGIEFIQPPYYLAKGPPRIQPVGGGPVLIKALTRAARQAGVDFLYGCAARRSSPKTAASPVWWSSRPARA